MLINLLCNINVVKMLMFISDSENNKHGGCLYVRLRRNGYTYLTEECNIKGDEVRLICQHEPSVSGN